MEKFETTFCSDAVSYQLSLGLNTVPVKARPVNKMTLALYLMVQANNAVFKIMILKKSNKFIFQNEATGKFEMIDFSETESKESELPGQPSEEQLGESFFISETAEN